MAAIECTLKIYSKKGCGQAEGICGRRKRRNRTQDPFWEWERNPSEVYFKDERRIERSEEERERGGRRRGREEGNEKGAE